MTEFQNAEQQLSKFRLRVAAAGLFVFVCFGRIGVRRNLKEQHQRNNGGNSHDRLHPRQCNTEFQC